MFLDPQRHIAHFDLDTFFVSVERRINPKLNGMPLLIGGSGDRGVVASCSYEARKFGIHSAMPIRQAKRLCKEAIVVPGNFDEYGKYSSLVTEVIRENVPLFEKASIDEFYMDLTGMDKFFGTLKFTNELKTKVIKESGLPISFALASNKLISKVATNEGKPNGQLTIPFGREKDFLAPLSIMKIPGIGKATGYQLLKMGVETVNMLSRIPVIMLQNMMGKTGAELWRKANGIDETPVVPYREQKSISTENTFQQDTIDIVFLKSELARMTEKIGFELRQQNKVTGCVAVKLRYSNFDTFNKQVSIPFTNSDDVLLQVAKDLFAKLYDRRLLVRLIGIRFTNLVPGNYQIKLYEDTQEKVKLFKAIDSIKGQFGESMLVRGSSMISLGAGRH
jgi:DNA polymerase-4